MEILFVSHKYPPATGGMEKQSFELINGMKSLARVHHIVYEGSGSRVRFFMSLNRRIKEVIKAHPGITVIHFNDGLLAAASLLHGGYGKLKRTATLHGLDVVFPVLFYQKLIFPLFNRFDLLFAVSRATAEACIRRGISAEKVIVVNNGVDPKIRSITGYAQMEALLKTKYGIHAGGKKILVAMGRPVRRKGFSWFIREVMPALNEDFILLLLGPVQDRESGDARMLRHLPRFLRNTAALFLGYPSDEAEIVRLLEEKRELQVFRLGKAPLEEVIDLLSHADAFVMPNIEVKGDMEGFGLVCLEAAMCGTRVFAASSGGITDAIIPDVNGFLLPSGDAEAWIYTLLQLKTAPENFTLTPHQIIANTTERFTWEKMTKAYFHHFSVLSNLT